MSSKIILTVFLVFGAVYLVNGAITSRKQSLNDLTYMVGDLYPNVICNTNIGGRTWTRYCTKDSQKGPLSCISICYCFDHKVDEPHWYDFPLSGDYVPFTCGSRGVKTCRKDTGCKSNEECDRYCWCSQGSKSWPAEEECNTI